MNGSRCTKPLQDGAPLPSKATSHEGESETRVYCHGITSNMPSVVLLCDGAELSEPEMITPVVTASGMWT